MDERAGRADLDVLVGGLGVLRIERVACPSLVVADVDHGRAVATPGAMWPSAALFACSTSRKLATSTDGAGSQVTGGSVGGVENATLASASATNPGGMGRPTAIGAEGRDIRAARAGGASGDPKGR